MDDIFTMRIVMSGPIDFYYRITCSEKQHEKQLEKEERARKWEMSNITFIEQNDE